PGQLVVDVEETPQKMTPVEPKHRFELVVASTAGFVRGGKRLLDLGCVETVERRIALPVRELEAGGGRRHSLHALIQRAVGVLVALPERQLIARVSRKQLVAAGAGE